MRAIIVLSLVAVALAAPPPPSEPIPIISQSDNIDPDGSFQYGYKTGNGIEAAASGAHRNIGAENLALQVQGQYQYTDNNGEIVQISYVADENGYNAQGNALPTPPTPPPIPPAIQRALAYLATAPPPKE